MNKLSRARSLLAYWGKKELGISGVELAKYFKITGSSISEAIARARARARARGERIVNENQYLVT